MNEHVPEHEMWMLAGLAAVLRWCEELLAILSGPLLVAGLAIALIDLMTDGGLSHISPAFTFVWAASIAIGVDAQLIGAFAKARHALRQQRHWTLAGLLALGAALAYVGWVAAQIYAVEQARHLTTAQALATLGFDQTTWLIQRSALSVFLVCLSGWTRYHPPSRAAALERPVDRAAVHQAQLEEARHKAQLRAVQAAGVRHAVSAGLGREEPFERPPTGPGTPQAAPAPRRQGSNPEPDAPAVTVASVEPASIDDRRRRRRQDAERRVRQAMARHPELSAKALARAAHVSRSTASKYRRLLAAEQPRQMAQ